MLYYASSAAYYRIVEEIGAKEGEFIRRYRPVLNTQIPKEENWRSYEPNYVDARKVLKMFI